MSAPRALAIALIVATSGCLEMIDYLRDPSYPKGPLEIVIDQLELDGAGPSVNVTIRVINPGDEPAWRMSIIEKPDFKPNMNTLLSGGVRDGTEGSISQSRSPFGFGNLFEENEVLPAKHEFTRRLIFDFTQDRSGGKGIPPGHFPRYEFSHGASYETPGKVWSETLDSCDMTPDGKKLPANCGTYRTHYPDATYQGPPADPENVGTPISP